MIDIVISNTTGIPIYQQMIDQISAQIIKGELPRETMLPPIRTVAADHYVVSKRSLLPLIIAHGLIDTLA